jgi:hypothetical protein
MTMTTMSDTVGLAFKSYHLVPDWNIHEAAWGARLIFEEIGQGGTGIVYDRQDAYGSKERLEASDALFRRFIKVMRWAIQHYYVESSSRDRWFLRDGLDVICASPQGSYGYLYVTMVCEFLSHQYETRFAELDEGREYNLFDMVDEALIHLDEKEDTYRRNKWTGIRKIQQQRKELQAAWGA